MSSRERILKKLNEGKQPFPGVSRPDVYRSMVPLDDRSSSALRARFIEEAQLASCAVHQVKTAQEAIPTLLSLIGEDKTISSWDLKHIPIPGLADELDRAGIKPVGQDASVRVGLTGVDAALAATGSLILASGAGRFRASSLLPTVHIAVMTADQIVPDLESWWGQQREAGLDRIRHHSNVVVVTGPSRTADIAMELVMGMHGPRELHIVILG
jgi:L-lactate dehydrogenase complex protein LldG